MPRIVKTSDEMDAEVMFGGPQLPPQDAAHQDDTNDEGDDEKTKKPTIEEQLEAMRLENAKLQGKLDAMAARPRDPVSPPPPKPKEKKNWEKMLFEDTDNAVEALRKEIKEEVITEVRGQYQQDTGEKEFWNDFWATNPDLKKAEDDDIARITLQRNYTALGDLPVSEAIKKLGELTRERILKYTGGKKKEPNPKEKAQTEAGGEKKPNPPAPQDDKIVSLSDLIRARRANRAKAISKAQTA